MIWQATSRRDVELIEKQERIDGVLAGFHEEIPPPPETLPWKMREILVCVHRHLFDPDFNVAAVRRRCRLRNNNVSTRFRCAVGMGLRDYIEAGRVEAAKRLLRHRDLEIYLISMAVGYEHQETFCRAFQRQVGCVPSEWREAQAARNGTDAAARRAGGGLGEEEVQP